MTLIKETRNPLGELPVSPNWVTSQLSVLMEKSIPALLRVARPL